MSELQLSLIAISGFFSGAIFGYVWREIRESLGWHNDKTR